METKFVEPEFSRCGFRRPKKGSSCPADLESNEDCLYSSKKKYLYWQQYHKTKSLKGNIVAGQSCPFGGDLWQLWVNHTLVHAEACGRRAMFAVCAPRGNEQLDASGRLEQYKECVSDPSALVFIPVEDLLSEISDLAPKEAIWQDWCAGLAMRYVIR